MNAEEPGESTREWAKTGENHGMVARELKCGTMSSVLWCVQVRKYIWRRLICTTVKTIFEFCVMWQWRGRGYKDLLLIMSLQKSVFPLEIPDFNLPHSIHSPVRIASPKFPYTLSSFHYLLEASLLRSIAHRLLLCASYFGQKVKRMIELWEMWGGNFWENNLMMTMMQATKRDWWKDKLFHAAWLRTFLWTHYVHTVESSLASNEWETAELWCLLICM